MTAQHQKPLGLGTEDKLLEDGRLDAGGRALQVAHDHLSQTEYGVDTCGKEVIGSVMFYYPPDAAVKQDVARQYDGEGVEGAAMTWRHTGQANNQSYRKTPHSLRAAASGER